MLFAIARNDGGVSIMRLVDGDDPSVEIAKWNEIDRNQVISVHPIAEEDVPADRIFRNAWTCASGKIDIHMPKAREIHRARLREIRTPLFTALDIDYQRADETGDQKKKAEIAARKQSLRDVTRHPSIDSANTVDELKSAIPPCLTGSKA